uniref:RidA family protein n=1 Tax=Compsopogon caeruleus TaxID=31354 RepID=A0A7S1XBY1_9RHOD
MSGGGVPGIRRIGSGPPGLNLFSSVTVHGETVYIAGQVADDRREDVRGQTRQVLGKIEERLREGGTDKAHLLQVMIWLKDIGEVGVMNEEYDQWLAGIEGRPVRATVQAEMVDPSIRVEIMATAARPSRAKVIETEEAAAAVGPYNQGIRTADGLIFASGCIGLDPKTGEFAGESVEEQTHQVLRNLWAILKAGGAAEPSDIIKTTILLDDIGDFAKVNAIYQNFFGSGRVPARATFSAKALPKGAKVEIEAIAQARDDAP